MRHSLAVSIVMLCSVPMLAEAQQAAGSAAATLEAETPSSTTTQTELVVHPARNVQPQQVAEALKNVFAKDPRVGTVEVSPGGVLFVRVSSGAREELQGFLEDFDPAPRRVDIDALLLTAIEDSNGPPPLTSLCGTIELVMGAIKQFQSDKRLVVHDRLSVPALGHQKANVLLFQRTPLNVDEIHPLTGQIMTTVEHAQVGMTVSITAHVDEDGKITVEVRFEAIEFTGQVLVGPPGTAGPVMANANLQTTIQLDNGHAKAVNVAFDDGANHSRPAILVIAARVRDKSE